MILSFVKLWRAENALENYLDSWWRVCSKMLIWRTAWEVRKRGELGRREFHAEGTVGVFEEGFVRVVFVGILIC